MKNHLWIALGRGVFDKLGPMRADFYLPDARLVQVSKNAPPGTAQLIALAPAMVEALEAAQRGDLAPCRALLESIPPGFRGEATGSRPLSPTIHP